ncbi:MAG: glycoside hydrolase [Actinomycetota bacterium]|nr:glycoside hydrolase [Actinomycetota bacterium]
MWSTSVDGGTNWTAPQPAPGVTACTGNEQLEPPSAPMFPEFASDPNVSVGVDGAAYLASVHAQPVIPMVCCGHVLVSASRDNGLHWAAPTSVDEPQNTGRSDPAFVTADPRISGRAYLAWNHLTPPSLKFAWTRDGGRTWSPASTAAVDAPGRVYDLAPLLVLSDGTLLLFFADYSLALEDASEQVMRSTDGGKTWSAPVHVADHTYPVSAQRVTVAAGRDDHVYAAWTNMSTGQVMVVRSADGGRTWDAPRQVERRERAQLATVAVHQDGSVGLLWYDERGGINGAEAWFAVSGDRGTTWRSVRLGGPFEGDVVLRTGSLLPLDNEPLGGYEGLVATREGFTAAFVMTRPIARFGPSDVFVARIRL